MHYFFVAEMSLSRASNLKWDVVAAEMVSKRGLSDTQKAVANLKATMMQGLDLPKYVKSYCDGIIHTSTGTFVHIL